VADAPYTTPEADLDEAELLAAVRRRAESRGVTTVDVLRELWARSTDAPPPEPPAAPAEAAPPAPRPVVSRRQREEHRLRRQLDMDAHRLLASTEPADADVYAFIAAKEGEIAAVLARATDIPPPMRAFLATLALARHCYEQGMRAVEVTVWMLQALRRLLSQYRAYLDIPRLFEPLAVTCNVLEAAMVGQLEPFKRLLAPRQKGVGQPPLPATARRTAMLAVATWSLRHDHLVATDTAADTEIVPRFAAAGIKLGRREPSNALRDVNELHRKRRTGRLPPSDRNAAAVLDLFSTLQASAEQGPLAARLAWVERLAAAAAETILF
jgi:hypothetical protein